ncbi:MAG: tyrosine-protein phosphatase [Rikenellaceae bacterium]|nr:tyrosine-protein phosphatase [Rikenellaceae bacterium]
MKRQNRMKYKMIPFMALCSLTWSCCTNSQDKIGYAGQELTGQVEILRDKLTKRAALRIDVPGEWQIFAGPSVEQIDLKHPIARGSDLGTFELDVPEYRRSYFQLVTPRGKAILAERLLPMTGGYNFRDLGGYRAQDGRYVKWGKIFRSDEMHNLTAEDLEYLANLPLFSVVDFRSAEEMEQAPDRIPVTATGYACSITPGNLMSAVDNDLLLPGRADSLMREMNRLLVTDPAAITQYIMLFELLGQEQHVPLLFRCSAGKDRTGMGAALVLYALGVDEETIMNDYLLSNVYLKEKYARYTTGNPELEALFTVRKDYLEAGLQAIEANYGSVDNFLQKVLLVDLDRMREMYLY